ncbi:hypothetical protein [Nocardia sp. NPDC047038]|uniref:hypothetical protein n=1 Tax=Nocardia sp. NPDC047038 TaxID=3154338 RepID=UPI0033D8626D
MEAGDEFRALARADGDLFFAVQDSQVGVFDDDGDELAAVAGSEFDALADDKDAAGLVNASLGSEGSGR